MNMAVPQQVPMNMGMFHSQMGAINNPMSQNQAGFGSNNEPNPLEIWWNYFLYNYLRAEFPDVVSKAMPKTQPPIVPKNPTRCIFALDLPEDVTEEELKAFFSNEQVLPSDVQVVNINRVKNQAIVEFPDEEIIENIITTKNMSLLKEKFVQVKLYQSPKDRVDYPENANLYFKDVDKELTQKDLHDYFTRFGNISSLKTNSNGYGYVQFHKLEDSDRCLAEHKAASKDYAVSKIHLMNIRRFKSKAQRESVKDINIEIEAAAPKHSEIKAGIVKALSEYGFTEEDLLVKAESPERLSLTLKASNIVKAAEIVAKKEVLAKQLDLKITSMAIDTKVEVFKNKVYMRYLKEDFNFDELKAYLTQNFCKIETIRSTIVDPESFKEERTEVARAKGTPMTFGKFSFAIIDCEDSQGAIKLVLKLPEDKKFIKTFLSKNYDRKHYFVNIHCKKQDRLSFLRKNMSHKMSVRLSNLLSTTEGQQRLWEKFMEFMAAVSYANYNQMVQQGLYPQMGGFGSGLHQGNYGRHGGAYQGQGKHHGEMGHSG